VAEQGAVAGGQQRGDEEAVLGEQFRRDGGVDAAMDAVQLADSEGAADHRPADSRGTKLRPRHDPGLIPRNGANCLGLVSVSGSDPNQFAHTAIVGAHAVPALPGFATTLRTHGPPSLGDAVSEQPHPVGGRTPTAHDVREQLT
jgi:hypothetical protein